MPDRSNVPADLVLAPHGVVVKGHLLINQMTLRERRNYLAEGLKSGFSEADARAAGYPEVDIRREFGETKLGAGSA
jgi:hypothetical protein